MPIGYTSDLYDLKDVSFADFASTCSRAWGARIMERDSDWDAPYAPREMSTYKAESLLKALNDYNTFMNMSDSEWLDNQDAACAEYLKSEGESNVTRLKRLNAYNGMLDQVKAWEPPTDEHVNFKTFMIEQIESSIEFDCKDYGDKYRPSMLNQTVDEYKATKLSDINREIDYSMKEIAAEINRVRESNKWVQDLVESLL